ncbi:unnamed protein product [Porites evermanni]|uniref:Uncharacterized protein n=1 Tax=Porites evermanni TaxID=104178 RepID=A0ABN8LUJ1_9CNID|nr:unnamed protein product [Porites evermanni]
MTSLDIFSVPSTDYNLQGFRMVSYHKLSTSITPMKFSVQSLDDYTDLNRSFFVIDLRLSTSGTNGIVEDANSASNANITKFTYAVNNLAHTLFKQVNVRFNGTLMTEQTDTYAYSAYLQTLLNYSRDDVESLLAPQGWVNLLNVSPTLTSGGGDDISTLAGYPHNNDHLLKTPTTPFRGNAIVRLIMRPYLPVFQTGKIMVSGVEMNFDFHFNSPDFYRTRSALLPCFRMQANVLEDVDITFHLCRLSLNPDVYASLEGQRKFRKQVVKYPVVRDQIRTFTFNGATTTRMEDNLFLGRVPQRMIVDMLDSTAFNGTKEKYPFSFQSKGVTSVRQYTEKEEYPYVTLEFAGNNTLKDLQGYRRFLEAARAVAKHCKFTVKPDEWGHNKNCSLFIMIRHPCNTLVGGPSGCGKSTWSRGFLRHADQLMHPPSRVFYYCYGAWQPAFDEMKKEKRVHFHAGLPTPEDFDQWFGPTQGDCWCWTISWKKASTTSACWILFSKQSHHRNISVMFLCQDLFPPGKFAKTISRNAHYIVAFKNPRDQVGMRTLTLQAFPNDLSHEMNIFRECTQRPFGYLMLNLHPASDDRYRLFTNVLPEEGPTETCERQA